jgi:hypothetical protein
MSDDPTPEKMERNQRWFEGYIERLENQSVQREKVAGGKYACPCCGHLTLDDRGGFDICPVCFWEDDGQDNADADICRGGPNGTLSLTQARANYQAFGASDERRKGNVRMPRPEEMKPS